MSLVDLLSHLGVMLSAEFQLFFQLDKIARAGLNSGDVLLLGLKFSSQSLHLSMVSFNLRHEELLIELGLQELLLEITVLRNEQLLLTVNLLDYRGVGN